MNLFMFDRKNNCVEIGSIMVSPSYRRGIRCTGMTEVAAYFRWINKDLETVDKSDMIRLTQSELKMSLWEKTK